MAHFTQLTCLRCWIAQSSCEVDITAFTMPRVKVSWVSSRMLWYCWLVAKSCFKIACASAFQLWSCGWLLWGSGFLVCSLLLHLPSDGHVGFVATVHSLTAQLCMFLRCGSITKLGTGKPDTENTFIESNGCSPFLEFLLLLFFVFLFLTKTKQRVLTWLLH